MKNGIRVAICVMMVVAVLAMSLSVFAVDEEGENPLLDMNNDTAAFLIWQLLQSWGIDVQFNDVTGYTREIQQQIESWIVEYLESQPSVENVMAWIADWYFKTDFWGNLVVNQTLLDDVKGFADWLVDVFNLTDNSTAVVDPIYTVNGFTLYNFNTYYEAHYDDGTNKVSGNKEYIAISVDLTSNNHASVLGYFFIREETTMYCYMVVVSRSQGQFQYETYQLATNGDEDYYSGGGTSSWNINDNNWYWDRFSQSYNSTHGYYLPDGQHWVVRDATALINALNYFDIEMEGENKIVTANIRLPSVEEGYQPGDSMTIIDGNPSYSLVDWDGKVTVDNLPAIVSTSTVSNPSLDTFWGFIPVLAEQTKDAIVLTRGLIYELPDELVVTFYAVMGGLILFGIIKIMREH